MERFKKYGLTMNLDKTEVMWIGKQREESNIRLEGKAFKQVKGLTSVSGWKYIGEQAGDNLQA